MRTFDHQKLGVYWRSVEVAAEVFRVSGSLRGTAMLIADQMIRAATSVVLNTAEGAGEFTPREKARFYRMARRSAAETSAALDILVAARLATAEEVAPAQHNLNEIGAMLTGIIKAQAKRTNRPTFATMARESRTGSNPVSSCPNTPTPNPQPKPKP